MLRRLATAQPCKVEARHQRRRCARRALTGFKSALPAAGQPFLPSLHRPLLLGTVQGCGCRCPSSACSAPACADACTAPACSPSGCAGSEGGRASPCAQPPHAAPAAARRPACRPHRPPAPPPSAARSAPGQPWSQSSCESRGPAQAAPLRRLTWSPPAPRQARAAARARAGRRAWRAGGRQREPRGRHRKCANLPPSPPPACMQVTLVALFPEARRRARLRPAPAVTPIAALCPCRWCPLPSQHLPRSPPPLRRRRPPRWRS